MENLTDPFQFKPRAGTSQQKWLNGIWPWPFVRKMPLRRYVELHQFRRKISHQPNHDLFEILVHFAFPDPQELIFTYLVIWRLRDKREYPQIAKRLGIPLKTATRWTKKATTLFFQFVSKADIDRKVLRGDVMLSMKDQADALLHA